MKLLYTYLILLSLILFSCAQNDMKYEQNVMTEEATDVAEEYMEKNLADPDGNLFRDTIIATDLTLFESRAEQKISDYYDYLSIITNPDYDPEFRQQAMKMAADLFADGSIWDQKLISSTDTLTIDDFLNLLFKGQHTLDKLTLKSVEIIDHFRFIKPGLYHAKFNSTQKVNGAKSQKSISVVLKQTEKEFGNQTKLIWEVFLKDIR